MLFSAAWKGMAAQNECVPQGPLYGWSKVPTVTRGLDITDASLPGGYSGTLYGSWPYVLGWAVVTADSGLPLREAGGVIVRDLRTHVFRTSTGKWEVLSAITVPAGGYLHDTANYANVIQGDISIVREGGMLCLPPIGRAFEVWNSRELLPVADFSALAVSVSIKRDSNTSIGSGFCVQVGADYYPFKTGMIAGVVPSVGTGRIIRAEKEWRTASLFVGNSQSIPFDVDALSTTHATRSD
jgi:hypothetical protein